MTQNSSPNNVPSAKQGTADGLASPGCVGAGGTIYCPMGEYLDWLYAELARLDGMPSSPDYPSYRECQAALRVYMRFVAHRLEQGA